MPVVMVAAAPDVCVSVPVPLSVKVRVPDADVTTVNVVDPATSGARMSVSLMFEPVIDSASPVTVSHFASLGMWL